MRETSDPAVLPFRCRGCGAETLRVVLDLGAQPASDHFPPAADAGPDPTWPLRVALCETCTLVQLVGDAPTDEETPLAVESDTSRRHAEASVRRLLHAHPELAGGTVREFASHHGGSWLGHLEASGCTISDGSPAELVIDVHALAHEPDLRGALAIRAASLAPGGRLVMEFHHLLALKEGAQFDTVRHGHWSYLSVTALDRLARAVGLRVVDVERIDVFGGSVLVELAHRWGARRPAAAVADVLDAEQAAGVTTVAGLAVLQEAARQAANALAEFLASARAQGRSVLAYGAPSKAAVLLGVSNVGTDVVPFTVDASRNKHGRRIPGCGLPIRPVAELVEARPDIVLVLTWDIADEVIQQLEESPGWGATYVVPLPTPRTLTA